MVVSKQQIQLLQYSGDNEKLFKLVITKELETKIRTFCALSPDREWSGVLFYTFEGSFKSGVTIRANDMYLMDQGNGVHTEFDLDAPEITRYLFMEGLTDNCMGLIHSHNRMKAFFSGEDSDTLTTHGEHMHNFVSLVVNNDGNYVARLTRQVRFDGFEERTVCGKSLSPLFNTDIVEEQRYNSHKKTEIKNAFLEYIDLNIVKEKPSELLLSAEIERFGEINSKSSYWQAGHTSGFCNTGKPYQATPYQVAPTEKAKQGNLFNDYGNDDDPFDGEELIITEDIQKELNSIPWRKLGYNQWLAQLFSGSPFVTTIHLNEDTFSELSEVYKKRFKNEANFAIWFEMWIDFLLPEFEFPKGRELKFVDHEEALIYKTYLTISSFESIVYKDVMLKSLLNRLI